MLRCATQRLWVNTVRRSARSSSCVIGRAGQALAQAAAAGSGGKQQEAAPSAHLAAVADAQPVADIQHCLAQLGRCLLRHHHHAAPSAAQAAAPQGTARAPL